MFLHLTPPILVVGVCLEHVGELCTNILRRKIGITPSQTGENFFLNTLKQHPWFIVMT